MTESGYKVVLTTRENGRTVHSPGSNFWTTEDGWNLEVEFQAEKHAGHPMRQKVIRAIGYKDGPGAAKKKAREWRLTQDERREWDGRRLNVMRKLVMDKARRSPKFRDWLLGTSSYAIIEDNWWHDQFWGNCVCGGPKCSKTHGSNWLGNILMETRRMVTHSGIHNVASAGR